MTTEPTKVVPIQEIFCEADGPAELEKSCQEASSNLFDSWLPILSQTLLRIEEMTNYKEYELKLKFATDDELAIGTRKFFKTQMAPVMDAVDSELTSVLGPFWTKMRAQSGGIIANHSILILWKATKDPLYAELTPEDKNIVNWACLLSDIAKRGSPVIQGRDNIHAFTSAAAALKVFEKLGVLGTASVENWGQIYRLLGESVQPLPQIWREDFRHGVPMVTQMHSHHNLPEIFYYLWEQQLAPRGSFIDLVFRLILFSHSMEALDTMPNKLNLSVAEIAKYCDAGFLRLLKIILIADNESYIFFDQAHISRCRQEVLNRYSTQ